MKAETVIGPVTIVEKPDRPYAGIRLQTPFPGMFAVATRALRDLRAWAKAEGRADEGPYFLRYYHCDMSEIMEIEAGIVLGAPLKLDEDLTPGSRPGQAPSLTKRPAPARVAGGVKVQPGLLPRGRYATLIYRGNGLRGNQALMQWGRDTGTRFEPIDPSLSESYVCRYEAYLTDYRTEPRKLLWDVELSIKIAG